MTPDILPISQGRLADFADDPVACMRKLHLAHGSLAVLEEGRQRVVFAFGPHYVQQVLSDTHTYHARFFAVRGPKKSPQRRLTCGILSMNGEEHKRHRRLVMGPFQKTSILNYRDGLSNLAERMVAEWQEGEVRDAHRDMTEYMLRVTSNLLFGFDESGLAYEIGRSIERWVRMNHEIGLGAFVSDERLTQGYGELLRNAEDLEKLIRQMIDFRRASSALSTDVLSLLIHAHDENGIGMTDDEVIGQAAVLFGAAHLTTANTLTWTLVLLSQHPRIALELRDELVNVLHGAPPTVEQFDQLTLLDRVLKESMRVLPASSYSQRVNSVPVQLGPLQLTVNTPIVFSQFIVHHSPDLYPDPERFTPDRWLTLNPPPYTYIPFAAGPRRCLGASLALMTLKTTLPVILQRYRLQVEQGAQISGKVIGTMLTPTTSVPMRVLPATEAFASSDVTGNIHEMVQLV